MRKKLSWKEREWAYEKWCEGNTQEQIAEALGCSRQTVSIALSGRDRVRPVLEYKKNE